MVSVITIRKRLARAAKEFVTEHGFAMSVSGRLYLEVLLTRAAITIVRDGRQDDVELAEERLRELLSHAGGAPPAVASHEPSIEPGGYSTI